MIDNGGGSAKGSMRVRVVRGRTATLADANIAFVSEVAVGALGFDT